MIATLIRFEDLGVEPTILKAIHDIGFEKPSPIQEKCIPKILEGVDLIGQAQTGTGKTAAFAIPILQRINSRYGKVQSIILTPTRELAIQVSGEIRRIGKNSRVKTLPIYGGQSIGRQIRALRQGVHIVIGTPGRVLDHIHRRTLKLDAVNIMVLDEADEMLDMGFVDDIEEVMRHLPEERQMLLFSATMPPEILRLSKRYMKQAKRISVNKGDVAAPSVTQVYYKVLEKNKLDGLCRILDSDDVELGIVFCRTKKGVDELAEALQSRGYLASALHGDLNQMQRNRVMQDFRNGRIELLVATDVAARGIDVSNVSHVINYDIPQDAESYVHRIGRTGRAGKSGIAMTLVTPREMKLLNTIHRETKSSLEARNLPTLEEVAEKQQATWIEQVLNAIHDGGDDVKVFKETVQTLAREHGVDILDVAAAALKLAFDERSPEADGYRFGETGAAPGMVRFFINAGKNIDMNPRDLVKTIADAADISDREIGKINIFDRFTFVEVPEEVAPFVFEALQQSRINGARINMEPARPREKR